MRESSQAPPRIFLRFFQWYCHPKMHDYIEGDLMEVYRTRLKESGKRTADLKFAIDVLLLFRPGIIRPSSYKNLNPNGMFKSYFKIGWRNLIRNKGYSIINISGLSLGMIVFMMIGLWVYDEMTFNRYHKNYERIARVVDHVSLDGETVTYGSLPMPVTEELRTNYKNEFDAVAAVSAGDRIITHDDKVFTRRGCFSDYALAEILSLETIKGSHLSFKEKSHVLLSESFSDAMFGRIDPTGKMIRIGNSDLSVVGIYKDFPGNSTFYGLDFIAPVDLLFSSRAAMNNWRSSSFQIYVLLNPNSTFVTASTKIKDILFNHTQEATQPRLDLNPMKRWHLYEFKDGRNVPARLELVNMVAIIGVFIMVLACINFVNLSTARSEKRAKEVGVRKTLGSMKRQLVNQFLCESFLVSAGALVLAVIAVAGLLPWFNNLSNKQIEIPFTSPVFWLVVTTSTAIVALLAGSYPAFYLSSFNPVKVIKGAVKSGRTTSVPRKILVVIQFSISVALVIGTLVMHDQIQFVKDRPTGYSREGMISIPYMTQEIISQYNTLRTELLKTTAVESVSQSSGPTTAIFSSADNLDWEGKDPTRQLLFGTICIDPYYDEVVSWKIKAGRNFSEEIASDTAGFIFNETAIRQMGLTDPVGKTVRWHNKSWTIIGIVDDMVMTSPFEEPMPTVFMIDNRERPFNYMNVRLSSDHPTSAAVAEVEKVFKKIAPKTPFEYRFADQEYALKFAAEESIGNVVFAFTLLAILISCMGLLGLASFVAEQRTKEIGIRKVLGASVSQVWQLVSYEFLVLVMIACVLTIPVSWYLMSNWLLQYDYRMELNWPLFAEAAACAIVITLVTVSYHALSAAITNPVKSLRSE